MDELTPSSSTSSVSLTESSSRKRAFEQLVICDQCDHPVEECISLKDDNENGQLYLEETVALADPRLSHFFENQCEDSLELNVTHYCLYDSNHHLVPIDSGLIESDKPVYLEGHLKPLTDTDDDPSNDSVPTHNIGPIEQWWISGFDGGERVLIGVESPLCRYNLLLPHPRYKIICESIEDKIMATKYIIEWIECNSQSNCSQLLQHLISKCPKLKLSRLYQILPFILDQIQSYDEAASPDDLKLFETIAIQELIESASQKSLTLKRTKSVKDENSVRSDRRKSTTNSSYATCTQLVATFFEEQFKGALNLRKEESKSTTIYKKLGNRGYGKSKRDLINSKIIWTSETKHYDSFSKRNYYESVRINGIQICLGNFVIIARNQRDPMEDNSGIGRVIDLFETIDGQKYAHIDFLCFSESTILDETGSPNCVYFLQECSDIGLYKLIDKIDVDLGLDLSLDKRDYVCDRIYSKDYGWFKCFDRQIVDLLEAKSCLGCYVQDKRRKINQIILSKCYTDRGDLLYFESITINGHYFKEQSFALVTPESVNLPDYFLKEMRCNQVNHDTSYDETLYPERYRKQFTEFVKGGLDDVNQIYSIVRIKSIFRKKSDANDDCQLEVQLFYRPQNCFENFKQIVDSALDEVYLSNDIQIINCVSLREPCEIYFLVDYKYRPDNLLIADRYFVTSFYNHQTKSFEPIPQDELSLFPSHQQQLVTDSVKPLKTLDLFSGCGGLASGFKESGASETLWAIEKDSSAAKSFGYNFPSSIVFNEDANCLLTRLLAGEQFSDQDNGRRLPQAGEVEMILGGPPCQGFSGMNRFSNRLYSVFKNSLLVTFLSYIDYYRPKVVVFENVRNFVQFERSKILKLTLSCLLKMNYQVTFGILQAGSYGVPQSRRRTFILATDPSLELPELPKPLHSFSARACQLDIVVGTTKRVKSIHHDQCHCYFRPFTVSDAISDLPDSVGHSLDYLCSYRSIKTFYQKLMRKELEDDSNVSLHVVPTTSLLNQARIDRIPCFPGADWRDLPNIRLLLPDGTAIEKLAYLYDDVKNGKTSNGSFRGVCDCASGKACSKLTSRPENTLIPWGLVHTANRNYQWSGLFGRLQWNGFFITTITKTVPSSKQGSVLHPRANRVISLRESARSQGFPDNYHFFGTIPEIKVQIGNAVPIPLGRVIGEQVLKSLGKTESEI